MQETAQGIEYTTAHHGTITGELRGSYQIKNTATILAALEILVKKGYTITTDSVQRAFPRVCTLTGFMGRWQTISNNPRTVCDAGHNTGGIEHITRQLAATNCDTLRIVFGMVSDKDISTVLSMMPRNARYYFTQASIKRAMPADELRIKAGEHGLNGNSYPTVAQALAAARNEATANDFIFIGGSCFIVADLLVGINNGTIEAQAL